MGKDRGDIKFLRQYFGAQGITPPDPRPLFSHCGPAHEADQESCQDDVVRALAGDELEIGVSAGVEGALEFFESVVDGAFGGNAEAVGVEGAVLFAGEKIRFLGWQLGECAGEKMGFGGRTQLVADEQAFCEKQVSNRRDDGCQQDADTFFALVKKVLQRFKSKREVSGGDGVADIKDAALACRRDEVAHIALANGVAWTEGCFDFIEFAVELCGIKPHARGENLDGVGRNLQSSGAHLLQGPGDNLLFARTKSERGLVVEGGAPGFREALVGRATLVRTRRAEKKSDTIRQALIEQVAKLFDDHDDIFGTAGDAVGKKGRALQPDEFRATQKRHGGEGLHRLASAGDSGIHRFHCAIDDLQTERIRAWSQLGGEFRGGALDGGIVGAADEMNR